jgi:hypothetical protein
VVEVRTPVCELLGIEQPIVRAPMVAVPELGAGQSVALARKPQPAPEIVAELVFGLEPKGEAS